MLIFLFTGQSYKWQSLQPGKQSSPGTNYKLRLTRSLTKEKTACILVIRSNGRFPNSASKNEIKAPLIKAGDTFPGSCSEKQKERLIFAEGRASRSHSIKYSLGLCAGTNTKFSRSLNTAWRVQYFSYLVNFPPNKVSKLCFSDQ